MKTKSIILDPSQKEQNENAQDQTKKRKLEENQDDNNKLDIYFQTIEILAKSSQSVADYSLGVLKENDELKAKVSSLEKENQELKNKIESLSCTSFFLKFQDSLLKEQNQKLQNLIDNHSPNINLNPAPSGNKFLQQSQNDGIIPGLKLHPIFAVSEKENAYKQQANSRKDTDAENNSPAINSIGLQFPKIIT